MEVLGVAAALPPGVRVFAGLVAVALLALGLWLLWSGRRERDVPLDDQPVTPRVPTRLETFRNSMTLPTRMAVGLSLALVGYHIAVYSNPGVHVLAVPLEHAWIMAVALTVSVLLSLGMDRLGE